MHYLFVFFAAWTSLLASSASSNVTSAEMSALDGKPTFRIGDAVSLRLKILGPSPRYDKLYFEASMPDHGHGTLQPVRVKQVAESEFLVEQLVLHMGGKWLFRIQLHAKATTPVVLSAVVECKGPICHLADQLRQ